MFGKYSVIQKRGVNFQVIRNKGPTVNQKNVYKESR